MANEQKKTDSDWASWGFIVVLFALGIWPVALLLLFVKLFGGEKKKETAPPLERTAAPNAQARAQTAGHSQAKVAQAARSVTKAPAMKRSNAAMLKLFGALLLIYGVFLCLGPAGAILAQGFVGAELVQSLLQALSLLVAGGGMFLCGTSMTRSMRRYAKYLAVLGDREAMDLNRLALTLDLPLRRVEKDLQAMIDKGYFGGKAYLNMELGYLFRSGTADEAFAKQKAAAEPETPREAEEGYSGILRNIRRANDRIADPVLSTKIDRLEEIASRIFRAVEEDPRKAGRIDTFLNYYLPTTQKLLDSYAEFEAAGVEGENLRQAKTRIETTMDAIVRGFEHQLDELYKADVLDVDSDIRVMETMLHRDTASVEQDFGLGGSAAARQEEKET